MSRADVRAGTILALVGGSARLLKANHNTRLISEAVEGLQNEAEKALAVFIPDDKSKQCQLVQQNLLKFAESAREDSQGNTSVLGYFSTMLLDDLLQIVTNKKKHDALEQCYQWADKIIQVSDPEDCAIDCRRIADRTVDDLYGVVGLVCCCTHNAKVQPRQAHRED